MSIQTNQFAAGARDRRRRSLLAIALVAMCYLSPDSAVAQHFAPGQWNAVSHLPPAAPQPYPSTGSLMMSPSQLRDEAEPEFRFARVRQPEPPELEPVSPGTNVGSTASAASADSSEDGLASVPDMYGDFFSRGNFAFAYACNCLRGTAEYPQLGSVKIGENNSALPQDRFYFLYQHYNQALNFELSTAAGNPAARSLSFDRYVLGAEKTFFDGIFSLEVRAPFSGNADTAFDEGFSANNGRAGNLALIVTSLLYQSQSSAVTAGLGLSAPTGSDAQITVEDCLLTVKNQSPKLQPFVAVAKTLGDRGFFQAFVQLDVSTAGNEVTLQTAAGRFVPYEIGKLSERTYLFVDASAGYWLYRAPRAALVTGLAAVAELHYNAGLDDADTLRVHTGKTQFQFGPQRSSLNIVNGTFGLQLELFQRTALRVAGMVPVTDRRNRSFGNELMISLNHRY